MSVDPHAHGGIYNVNTNFSLPRTFYYLIKGGMNMRRKHEVLLEGAIANLTDQNLTFSIGGDVITTFFPTEDYRVGRHVQFDGKLSDAGELYGRLNGCFKLYYPKIPVTIAEETDAREIHCWEPKIPKEKWGRQYFIVPYLTAVKALIEHWYSLPYLLIPAGKTRDGSKSSPGQGFILASLLQPDISA